MAFDIGEARPLLAATPRALRALLGELPAAWTEVNEGGATWTVREVLGHLIHGEDSDWIPRTRQILAGGATPFVPFEREAFRRLFAGTAVRDLLELFAIRRAANLAILDGLALTPEALARNGIHPEFGSVTLAQLLATWVAHDLSHLAQIARVMAKRYSEDVGPWQAYLSIFSR